MADSLLSDNGQPKAYQYEPLQPDDNQIRLLHISKNDQEQAVFSLKAFDMDDCPSYMALSYTWGPPLPTRTIVVDGAKFTVRENLWSFLDTFTGSGITVLDEVDAPLNVPEYMWIDQLCIDQSSNSEKSHQVQRMAQIFKQASGVFAWLGMPDDHSDDAMRFIRHSSFLKTTLWTASGSIVHPVGTILKNEHHAYYQKLLESRKSIEDLYSRPYWDRLWIVQEISLAKSVLLVCGAFAVHFEAFRNVLQLLIELPELSDELSSDQDFNTIITLHITHQSLGRGQPRRLEDALDYFSGLECEHPHDKIYALLAISEGDYRIVVDYAKPAGIVFREVVLVLRRIRLLSSEPWYRNGRPFVNQWFMRLAEHMGADLQKFNPSTLTDVAWKDALDLGETIFSDESYWEHFK
jgi:hypothetical protein